MKRLVTIGIIGVSMGLLLSACARTHTSEYHGVAYKMNFERQIINPKAPKEDELKDDVSGPIGESIYRRYSDTYKEAIPSKLLIEP